MDLLTILKNSLWAALFATEFGVILTTPARALVSCFVCGFTGRCVRDLCMGSGLNQNWATAVAAAVVVLLAATIVRRHAISPVVLICGILPLGSAVAMFNMIDASMIPVGKGDRDGIAATEENERVRPCQALGRLALRNSLSRSLSK